MATKIQYRFTPKRSSVSSDWDTLQEAIDYRNMMYDPDWDECSLKESGVIEKITITSEILDV